MKNLIGQRNERSPMQISPQRSSDFIHNCAPNVDETAAANNAFHGMEEERATLARNDEF